MQAHCDISEVIRFCRATQRYIAKRDEKIPLRMRIKDIALSRVRYGYKREVVVDILEVISCHKGLPERIRVDNGPEFVSKALDNLLIRNKYEVIYI